jgi:hypothetical protein
VEADRDRAKIILENKDRLSLNLELYAEPFKPEKHLLLEHDFIKMDIEGYEMLLLPYLKNCKPCVVETHNSCLKEEFEKLGFKFIRNLSNATGFEISLLANYPLPTVI